MEHLPEWITRVAGELHLDGAPARALVERFGTPLVVYSRSRLRSNAEQLRGAFTALDPRAVVAYACKACYQVEVLRVFEEQGLSIEVMSAWELELALEAGFPGDRVIVNGLGKTPQELRRALSAGVSLINVDAMQDLLLVAEVAEELGARAPVGVRVSPSLTDERFSRAPGKLGLDIDSGDADAVLAAALASPSLELKAVHVHCYSLQNTPEMSERVLERLVEFVSERAPDFEGWPLTVDVGGGFNSRYLIERAGSHIEDFAARMVPRVRGLPGDPSTIVEPGTFLVNDAAVVLTQIVAEKTSAGRRWLIVDAGVNVLNPSVFADYEVLPLTHDGGPEGPASVADGLCSPAAIRRAAQLPLSAGRGDTLAVLNCGAYTVSSARCWGYPPIPVVMLEEGGPRVLLSADTAGTLLRGMHGLGEAP